MFKSDYRAEGGLAPSIDSPKTDLQATALLLARMPLARGQNPQAKLFCTMFLLDDRTVEYI